MNKVLLILFFILGLYVPSFLLGQFIITVKSWETNCHFPILIAFSIWLIVCSILLYLLIRQSLEIQARQDETAARLKSEQDFREFQQQERELQKRERETKQRMSFQDFEKLLELYKRDNAISFEAFTKFYDWYKHKNL